MKDGDCVQLLKGVLPLLRMRWNGFRKVRGQVCKRIDCRMQELGIVGVAAYQSYLERTPEEWQILDALCRVTISRFYRDPEVFRALERDVLVRLAQTVSAGGRRELRCWSAGCASGEEPYTLALLWNLAIGPQFSSLDITILATDADSTMISRAEEGCYGPGSLRNLPQDWKKALVREGNHWCIGKREREKVKFLEQDIRSGEPEGLFHLILCRNMAFTYFDHDLQLHTLGRFHQKLHEDGALAIGVHESLPQDAAGFLPWPGSRSIYRKTAA